MPVPRSLPGWETSWHVVRPSPPRLNAERTEAETVTSAHQQLLESLVPESDQWTGFFHWRCYWDYTNGVAGDLQSHALDQINAIVGMGIPETCVATGGLYFWRDGRETPDTWNAVFDYPERGLSINYAHVAMSDHYGTGVQFMGNDAALDLSGNEVKLFAERASTLYRDRVTELRKASGSFDISKDPVETYRPEASFEETSHIGDWLRGIQEGKPTRSNIDTAWEEIVTVIMAYESFRRGCKVSWDREKEEIV